MRKRYMIFGYLGPLDGWSIVINNDGFDNLHDASSAYLANIGHSIPLILVDILVDNQIEQEYK